MVDEYIGWLGRESASPRLQQGESGLTRLDRCRPNFIETCLVAADTGVVSLLRWLVGA